MNTYLHMSRFDYYKSHFKFKLYLSTKTKLSLDKNLFQTLIAMSHTVSEGLVISANIEIVCSN